MQKLILFIIAVFIISCNSAPKKPKDSIKTNTKALKPIEEERVATIIGDTLRVYKKCAVLFTQDSIETAKRKTETGEQEFYTGADDYLYYQAKARDFLDSIKLPIVDARGQKWIKFMLNNKPVHTVEIAAQPELMGAYFFNPPKEPQKPDLLDIDEEYDSYFNN